MQLNMYAVRVRFVADAKGALESKPKRVIVTLACNHEDALQRARSCFVDVTRAGVVVEYDDPSMLADTISVEALVYA